MKRLFLFSTILCIAFNSFAQTENPLEKGSIISQFEYITENSNNWEDFKVVKKSWIEKLQKNILDSLNDLNTQLSEKQTITSDHQAKTDSLNDEIAKINMQLLNIEKEQNNIDFLGLSLEKTTYKNMMYAISAVLLLFLLIFIYRFNRSNNLTNEIRQSFSEVQEEFATYKKRALEKEQKLARELQNELNKRMS
jgi:preprotein translocase subunit SecF